MVGVVPQVPSPLGNTERHHSLSMCCLGGSSPANRQNTRIKRPNATASREARSLRTQELEQIMGQLTGSHSVQIVADEQYLQLAPVQLAHVPSPLGW